MATETSTLAPGAFCWVDLATSDPKAATAFYADLFGWKSEDHQLPHGTYTIFILNGHHVGGMMALTDEMCKKGVPPNWMSHVYVTDAAAIAKRVPELGGMVLKAPFDVGMGTLSVCADPTGAAFCLWQPKEKLGDSVYNVPGTLCWNELLTPDVDKAKDFYHNLFNWTLDTRDFGGMPYTEIKNNGRSNGGMMTLPEEAKKMGAPPNWMAYFAVADCEATVEKATAKGARVINPPMDIPTVGRMAILADPQGAVFSVIKLANPGKG